jgi:putative transposase
MPWKTIVPEEQRFLFVAAILKAGESMASTCRQFKISRKTGYKWLGRFKAVGVVGLKERSHAPHDHGNTTDIETSKRVIAVRKKHVRWGPRKVKSFLEKKNPKTDWPAASTIGGIFDRAGLTAHRPRRQRAEDPPVALAGLTEAQQPNDVWTADYKGWFRTGDGHRCDPLTIQDRFSRFLILLRITKTMQSPSVQRAFADAFREFGMPLIIRTDNGSPFASMGLGGLTRFSVWLIKLGIQPERIRPGSPQENGRHERFHRTMKEQVASPPGPTVLAQVRRHFVLRREYNSERPSEALGQRTPASVYHPSPRVYTGRADHPEYPAHWLVRSVRSNGEIKWNGTTIFLAESLIGEPVGLDQVNDHEWFIYFGALPLARINEKGIITPFRAVREKRKHKHANKAGDKEKPAHPTK